MIMVPKCKCGGLLCTVAEAESIHWTASVLKNLGYSQRESKLHAKVLERSRIGLICDDCQSRYYLADKHQSSIKCICETVMLRKNLSDKDDGSRYDWIEQVWDCISCECSLSIRFLMETRDVVLWLSGPGGLSEVDLVSRHGRNRKIGNLQ